MSLLKLLKSIESPEFVAQVGVVSTQHAFESAIARHPWAQELLGLARGSASARVVYGRMMALLQTPVDPSFSHPYDVAIAVYLRVVDIVAPLLAVDAAREVLAVRNAWWARRLAERIAAAAPETAVVSEHLVFIPGPVRASAATGAYSATMPSRNLADIGVVSARTDVAAKGSHTTSSGHAVVHVAFGVRTVTGAR